MDPFIVDLNARKYHPLRDGEITKKTFINRQLNEQNKHTPLQIQKEKRRRKYKETAVRKLLTCFSLF